MKKKDQIHYNDQEWIKQKDEIKKNVEDWKERNRFKRQEKIILEAFYYIIYLDKNLPDSSKRILYLPIVQIIDIMRGCFASQQNLALFSSAFNARCSFELFINISYIYFNKNKKELCKRYNDYARLEMLLNSPYVPSPLSYNEEKEREYLKKVHPYWIKDISSNKRPHWTGKNKMTIKKIVNFLYDKNHVRKTPFGDLKGEYFRLYTLMSTYIHTSSITRNLFTKDRVGFSFFPSILNTQAVFYNLSSVICFCGIVGLPEGYTKDIKGLLNSLLSEYEKYCEGKSDWIKTYNQE